MRGEPNRKVRGDYHLDVVGKHLKVTQPIQEYVEDKLGGIDRMLPDLIEALVRIELQKREHRVEIALKFSHFNVRAHASTESVYSAIDKAIERLHAKFRKWKGKIQDHRPRGPEVEQVEVAIFQGEDGTNRELDDEIIEENNTSLRQDDYSLPKVVRRKHRLLKLLTLDEAVMKMELSSDHFLVYRSEEDHSLRILYRRRDGSYGMICPE